MKTFWVVHTTGADLAVESETRAQRLLDIHKLKFPEDPLSKVEEVQADIIQGGLTQGGYILTNDRRRYKLAPRQ